MLWRAWLASASRHPAWRGVVLTLMLLSIVLLVGALLGRLHWLAALPAAVLPLLRRGLALAGVAQSLLGTLRSARGQAGGSGGGPGGGAGPNNAEAGSGRKRTQGDPGLSRTDALEILGLEGTPSRDEIIAAHRRLMQKLHPDRGGSDWLATRLNAARELLLSQLDG